MLALKKLSKSKISTRCTRLNDFYCQSVTESVWNAYGLLRLVGVGVRRCFGSRSPSFKNYAVKSDKKRLTFRYYPHGSNILRFNLDIRNMMSRNKTYSNHKTDARGSDHPRYAFRREQLITIRSQSMNCWTLLLMQGLNVCYALPYSLYSYCAIGFIL